MSGRQLHAYKDISILSVFTLVSATLAFFAQVFFARHLSISDYGTLSSSLVFVTMLAPLAGFGVGQYWLNVFGTEGWNAQRWLRPSAQFVVLASLTISVLLIGSILYTDSHNLDSLVLWLVPLIVAMALMELVTARLQLEERFFLLALWQLLPNSGRFLLAALVIGYGGGLYTVGKGFFILALLIVVIGMFSLSGMVRGHLRLAGHGTEIQNHSERISPSLIMIPIKSWPFALAGFFYLIYFQADILLLNWFIGVDAVSIYNVAFTVMIAVYLIPGIIFQKYLLPKQHRWSEHDRNRLLAVYRYGCGLMLTLGLVIMVILALVSPWVVPIIFGEEFVESGVLLLLLGLCIPFRFLATSVGALLVVQEHMRRKVIYMGSVAVVNVLLNLILIPTFSYYGAAVATLFSEVMLLSIYLLAVRRWMFGADAWRGWTLRYRETNSET